MVALDAQGGPVLLLAHYAVLALSQAIRALAAALGPAGRLVDNPLVRGLVAAPQEALRGRVSTRLGPAARVASLGYLLAARKPS